MSMVGMTGVLYADDKRVSPARSSPSSINDLIRQSPTLPVTPRTEPLRLRLVMLTTNSDNSRHRQIKGDGTDAKEEGKEDRLGEGEEETGRSQ
jgi:hypothetical protein